MKQRRRIEITAFRRRTTIILRDPPRTGGSVFDCLQARQRPPSGLNVGASEGREADSSSARPGPLRTLPDDDGAAGGDTCAD